MLVLWNDSWLLLTLYPKWKYLFQKTENVVCSNKTYNCVRDRMLLVSRAYSNRICTPYGTKFSGKSCIRDSNRSSWSIDRQKSDIFYFCSDVESWFPVRSNDIARIWYVVSTMVENPHRFDVWLVVWLDIPTVECLNLYFYRPNS